MIGRRAIYRAMSFLGSCSCGGRPCLGRGHCAVLFDGNDVATQMISYSAEPRLAHLEDNLEHWKEYKALCTASRFLHLKFSWDPLDENIAE